MNIQSRRAVLTGATVSAIAGASIVNVGAVCIFPGSDGPDAELIEIGKRFMQLDRAAREAWKAWEPHNQRSVDSAMAYSALLPADLPLPLRHDIMEQFFKGDRETPEYTRLYDIANRLSDQRDDAMYEAFKHRPSTLPGFGVYAVIIKVWNAPLWRKEPDDLDLDEITVRLLVDHLIDHSDVIPALSAA